LKFLSWCHGNSPFELTNASKPLAYLMPWGGSM
jgi:hypothetical protein